MKKCSKERDKKEEIFGNDEKNIPHRKPKPTFVECIP